MSVGSPRSSNATAASQPRGRYGWERLAVLLAEPNLPDLIEQYWAELWPYKDIPCDVDWPRLFSYEEAGFYKVWTARVGPTLAGFASFYVQPYIHAKTTVFAIDGGHFLSPAFRDNSRVGWRMWKTARAALKAEGAKIIVAHDNALRPLMPFFLALDMQPRASLFWGRL